MAADTPNNQNGHSGDALTTTLLGELRTIAARHLRRERAGHSLATSYLVHEAWMVLDKQRNLSPKERATYLAAASNTIRRILVDHARKRARHKRGGPEANRVSLRSSVAGDAINGSQQFLDVLALEKALQKLAIVNSRAKEVVVQRFYGGLTNEEIARNLSVSLRTVVADWTFARAWLSSEM